jgi:hypothetical protein
LPPTVTFCPLCRLALCVALLTSAGCGVADYEKKMQDAEVRVQRIDEENRLLGDPLDVPARSGAPAVVVFLRPPKGVPSVPQKDAFPFRYVATSGVCSDVYVALADGPKQVEKLIEDTFEEAAQNWQAVTVNSGGKKAVSFEAVEFLDPKTPANTPDVYVAYVHQSVGVVFHVANKNREAAKPSLQMSMETYLEGDEAAKARANFSKRKAH